MTRLGRAEPPIARGAGVLQRDPEDLFASLRMHGSFRKRGIASPDRGLISRLVPCSRLAVRSALSLQPNPSAERDPVRHRVVDGGKEPAPSAESRGGREEHEAKPKVRDAGVVLVRLLPSTWSVASAVAYTYRSDPFG